MSCEIKVNALIRKVDRPTFTSHCLLQSRGTGLRDGIPKFSSAKVNVIDAEEIHILDMPCKSRPPHAKVQIGGVYSWEAIRRTG